MRKSMEPPYILGRVELGAGDTGGALGRIPTRRSALVKPTQRLCGRQANRLQSRFVSGYCKEFVNLSECTKHYDTSATANAAAARSTNSCSTQFGHLVHKGSAVILCCGFQVSDFSRVKRGREKRGTWRLTKTGVKHGAESIESAHLQTWESKSLCRVVATTAIETFPPFLS
jgi:hypothetical protein